MKAAPRSSWSSLGAPLLKPLAQAERQYALIDGAQVDNLGRLLPTLRGGVQHRPVFAGPLAPDLTDATPHLVEVEGQDAYRGLLTSTFLTAVPFCGALSWLVSPLAIDELVARLRHRLDVRLPDRFDCVNRFFDARIAPAVHECLTESQRASFFSVSTQWWVVSHKHQWRSLACHFSSFDPHTAPLLLDEAQQNFMRIKKAIELLDEEVAKVPAQQKVLLINVAVFGFSRGAAEARAFVRDLAAKCVAQGGAYRYNDKPLRIAFAGLFDTVCSAYGDLAAGSMTQNGGHNGWAAGMELPLMVEQTVHMNAAHELRRRFPLDSTRIGASYPDNTREFWYPGVHSDVGGGYAPQYQGRVNTISRFALNHMFDLAFAGGVLFEKVADLPGRVQDEFNKDDSALRAAFNAYINAVPMKTGPMEEVQAAHMGLFHRWLKKRVKTKAELPSTQRLRSALDAARARQKEALDQRMALVRMNGGFDQYPKFSPEAQKQYDDLLKRERQGNADASEAGSELSGLSNENAKYLWDVQDIQGRAAYGGKLTLRERTIKAAWDDDTDLPPAVDDFFDTFAHDSVAHFSCDTSRLSDWRTIFFGAIKYKPS